MDESWRATGREANEFLVGIDSCSRARGQADLVGALWRALKNAEWHANFQQFLVSEELGCCI
jgi:hypothetical protein